MGKSSYRRLKRLYDTQGRDFHMRCEDYFYGSVTVGERGQIVIPAEARLELDIKPGDKLLVMRHPAYEGLMVSKFDAVNDFIDDFKRKLNEAIKEEDQQPNHADHKEKTG